MRIFCAFVVGLLIASVSVVIGFELMNWAASIEGLRFSIAALISFLVAVIMVGGGTAGLLVGIYIGTNDFEDV